MAISDHSRPMQVPPTAQASGHVYDTKRQEVGSRAAWRAVQCAGGPWETKGIPARVGSARHATVGPAAD